MMAYICFGLADHCIPSALVILTGLGQLTLLFEILTV